MRRARWSLLAFALIFSGSCGTDDTLPQGVPLVTLDGGPGDGGSIDAGFVDGGARDAGESDAGESDAGQIDAGPVADAGESDAGESDSGAFAIACGDAGCAAGACEALDGGAVACGVVCGAACATTCEENRCAPDDAGFVTAYCVGGAWSTSPTCDDGNVCTTHDACQSGRCTGAPNTGASCDDGKVCTTGDTCDAAGHCAGTAVSAGIHRFFSPGASSFSWATPADWSFSGWNDQGAAWASVPGGSAINLLFDDTAVDRIVSFASSQGSYANSGITAGKALAHAGDSSTVELQVAAYTCGAVSGSCGAIGGSGAARHYFFVAGHGSPPAGSGSGAGIWVCPP